MHLNQQHSLLVVFLFSIFFLFFFTFSILAEQNNEEAKENDKDQQQQQQQIFSAVFASCNKAWLNQDYWLNVIAPVAEYENNKFSEENNNNNDNDSKKMIDVMLWLGDAVYHDMPENHSILHGMRYWDVRADNASVIEQSYQRQLAHPQYQEFLIKKTKFITGVYDDHDYGKDDGGKEFDLANESQQLFLDFIGVPKNNKNVLKSEKDKDKVKDNNNNNNNIDIASKIRREKRKGVYVFEKFPLNIKDSTTATATTTTTKSKQNKNVCFIGLDIRTNRDPTYAGTAGNDDIDNLGLQQWLWLKTVLDTGIDAEIEFPEMNWQIPSSSMNKSNLTEYKNNMMQKLSRVAKEKATKLGISNIDDVCALTLIGSGVQFISDEKPTENWGQFIQSRDLFMYMLAESRARNIVLLSGDIHLSEVFELKGKESPFRSVSDKNNNNNKEEEEQEEQSLYEFTSSGLTHDSSRLTPSPFYHFLFPNRRRVQKAFLKKNFGVVRLYTSASSNENEKENDFKVVVSIHSIDSGEEVIRVEPKFVKLTKKQQKDSSTHYYYYHLDPLPSLLSQVMYGVQEKIAPKLARHLVIKFTALMFFAFVFISVVIILTVIVKYFRRGEKVKND